MQVVDLQRMYMQYKEKQHTVAQHRAFLLKRLYAADDTLSFVEAHSELSAFETKHGLLAHTPLATMPVFTSELTI